jgi:hypothetical protein
MLEQFFLTNFFSNFEIRTHDRQVEFLVNSKLIFENNSTINPKKATNFPTHHNTFPS